MTLLEQCQIWHEREEYRKIIDAIEALPAGERTPELDSELARACNNLAGPEDRALFEKAVALLAPHEAYFRGDHCWNYRMGYAYYYLDREDAALRYFRQALEARPGDRDTLEFMENCLHCLALPRFTRCFRVRAEEAWAAFAEREADLRAAMDGSPAGEGEALETCRRLLGLALGDPAVALGRRGERYQLILSPAGSHARLFPLVFFRRRAPERVLEHWDVLVGAPPSAGAVLRADGLELRAEEVQVWTERREAGQVALTLYCERLLPLLREDGERARRMLSALTAQVLGEVNAITRLCGLTAAAAPEAGPAVSLAELPRALEDMGLPLFRDAETCLEACARPYRPDPVEDREADWRLDVSAGETRLPALVDEYLRGETGVTDALHRDGVAAGFLILPLDALSGEDRERRLRDLRDALREAVLDAAGPEAVAFLGWADGLYCGYLDFLAWDLQAVLAATADFLRESDLSWAAFHSFRRDVGTVRLSGPEDGEAPEVDPETGSLLSRADLEQLESFCGEASGYYGKMLDYLTRFIRDGAEAGRFTEAQARRDLQIALWYAYACNNLDEYFWYHRAAQWMPASERNARGCGAWYYRYSCALMYCGRLEEARSYAEQGTREEPDYPWIWLQAGKLRAHFGDKAGALEAVERGLALEPGDYEFLTLRAEIGAGASIEEMEYHWISPDADRRLQAGLDESADGKRRAIACITTSGEGLSAFIRIFRPDPEDYTRDDPYCSFRRAVRGQPVELVFRMNEAGLSKLGGGWLLTQRERLDSGRWLQHPLPGGEEGVLEAVLFDLDRQVSLVYRGREEDSARFQVRVDGDGVPDPASLEPLPAGEEPGPAALYSEAELEAVERHIAARFGPVERVFHELISPDIQVDLCLIGPSEDREYCTLVTMGMGARRMNVPEELAEYRLERAELVLALPPDWRLDEASMKEERWYWPVRLLKVLARLPITCDTWLGWGHTMDNQGPFSEDTALCGAILISPQGAEEGAEVCTLPGGEEVNFYQVIPLYREELEYKLSHSAEELLERLERVSFVVCPDRPGALEEGAEEGDAAVLDDGARHLALLREENLPAEELAPWNHMAVYLRWCIGQDLMSLAFLERYWDTVQQCQSDPEHTDLRPFIRDELAGRLSFPLFDEEGEAFARCCYGGASGFLSDVEAYALRRPGAPRRGAYLLLPFDEDCYQDLARLLQARWDDWERRQHSAP